MDETTATLKAMTREYELEKSWLDSAETTEDKLEHAMAIIDLLTRALAISTGQAQEAARQTREAARQTERAIDQSRDAIRCVDDVHLFYAEPAGEA